MNTFSPLRYPGGKGKLAHYLSQVISLNNLEGGHYVEPFAGGAAVALELLFSERVHRIHINDIDLCVYAFWHSALYETEALITRIVETNIAVPTWLRAREIKRSPASHSLLDVGFSTFFLNRTNRSGILRGGVIGGLQQEGAWKIACRFNKDELISRIRRIGFFRSRISLSNMDAAVFLSQRVPPVPSKCLIYIDPPYYVKGAYLYQNHYEHRDHVDLARLISKIKLHKWIVSYDNSEHVTKMYKKFEQEEFDINYSARSFAVGKEIMIFSKDLARPAKVYCSERERQKITA